MGRKRREERRNAPPGRPLFGSSPGPLPPERYDPPPQQEQPPDDIWFASDPHPDVALHNLFRWNRPGRLPIGIDNRSGGWDMTQRDKHLLAIAPPQCHAGKTASIIIPHILAHPGPVVTATTKIDVLTATAMARAQIGNLWCYAPDGDTSHLPPGIRVLRWSPITGADDWEFAITTARAMVGALSTEGVKEGTHWTDRAAAMLAPVFHWAALTGATMANVVSVVHGHRTALVTVLAGLEERGAATAASMLTSVLHSAEGERGSIASSASRALQAYDFSGAIRSTEQPNFDPINFVNGGTWPVRADTIYITARSSKQQNVASLIVALLGQIQDAAYRRFRNLAVKGLIGEAGSGPILFALDELYNLAPIPDLPHILSEGGSQGLLVTAAVQDLALLKSRWPKEGRSFLSLFGHVVVFPPVKDEDLRKQVSDLLGKVDVEYRSETRKEQPTSAPFWGPVTYEDRVEHTTYSTQRRPRYDIDAVAAGPVPGYPDFVFHFGPDGPNVLRMTPTTAPPRGPPSSPPTSSGR